MHQVTILMPDVGVLNVVLGFVALVAIVQVFKWLISFIPYFGG